MDERKEKLMSGLTVFQLVIDLICIALLISVSVYYRVKYGFDYFFGVYPGHLRRYLCFIIMADALACTVNFRNETIFHFHGILCLVYSFIIGPFIIPSLRINPFFGFVLFMGLSLPYLIYLIVKIIRKQKI